MGLDAGGMSRNMSEVPVGEQPSGLALRRRPSYSCDRGLLRSQLALGPFPFLCISKHGL